MHKNRLLTPVAALVFLVFFIFWAVIAVKGLQGEHNIAETFSALYGLMALYGGVIGLSISKKWGGFRSLIGRSVMFISLGLLAQEVGQLTYSGYTYLAHVEIPYPSLGDIGYFGSVLLYIAAALSLIKALSTKSTRKLGLNRVWIALIPLALLSISYYTFLRGYQADFSHPLTVFLDFGYPLGQAFYISLGLLALALSFRYLGGIMKPVILFLIFALVLQYAADFTFLYQNNRGTWQTAGFNELMYLVAYFVMTLSLLRFLKVFSGLTQRSNDTDTEGAQ